MTLQTNARRVLVVTAGETAGPNIEAVGRLSGFEVEGIVGDADPAQAIEDGDILVVDGTLADRARRRVGLPIVPVRAAA